MGDLVVNIKLAVATVIDSVVRRLKRAIWQMPRMMRLILLREGDNIQGMLQGQMQGIRSICGLKIEQKSW